MSECHLVLSVVDSDGWYISHFCLPWTIVVGISPVFVPRGKIGRNINWFCLSWTIIIVLSPDDFVCHGPYWLVYHLVVSVMDIIGSLISQFCLSSFVCL